MDTVPDQHRARAPRIVQVAVLTVSDTRTMMTDVSGTLIVERVEEAGHVVIDRQIVADDAVEIRRWVEEHGRLGQADAAIVTGGTGVSSRDVTPEAVELLYRKLIPGFGELFRLLSYIEVGPATILSRASAGLIGTMVVFLLPGSRAGVELALTRIIVPELPHLVGQARKG